MYNVAQYIERCLESVFNQNFPIENYEVILINDGSPDNSEDLARKYCKGRSIVRIISQENKGLGGARNTGIDNAKGDYIIFLDADDVISKDALNSINLVVQNDRFDIIELSCSLVDEDLEVFSTFSPNNLFEVFPGKTYYLNNKSLHSVCNKIYSKYFLDRFNLRFKEHIYVEDFEFNTRALHFANKMISKQIHFQSFVQTKGSITRDSKMKTKQKIVNDNLAITKSIVAFKESVDLKNSSDHYFFNERLSLLNVGAIYRAYINGFPVNDTLKILNNLKRENIYFMDYKVMDKKKNLFRYIVHSHSNLFKLLLRIRDIRN